MSLASLLQLSRSGFLGSAPHPLAESGCCHHEKCSVLAKSLPPSEFSLYQFSFRNIGGGVKCSFVPGGHLVTSPPLPLLWPEARRTLNWQHRAWHCICLRSPGPGYFCPPVPAPASALLSAATASPAPTDTGCNAPVHVPCHLSGCRSSSSVGAGVLGCL